MLQRLRDWFDFSDVREYPLYAGTIFLSAFLLFQVQPMIGRFLLPYFGGSASVWGASLVFFTSTLFFGYLYVYAISDLSFSRQIRIHAILLGFAACFVGGILLFSDTPYLSVDWVLATAETPAIQVLLALAATIGIPYLLLSTTGPLLQHWYAHETKKEPYPLYALSNLGSFLALGTYPFITEPLFGLTNQQFLWAILFLCCVGFLAATAYSFRTVASRDPLPETQSSAEKIPLKRLLLWLLLAALPAAMLVATTARITQVIAPIPFLWIVPLALYLASFIFAFRGWGAGGLTPLVVLVSAIASYAYLEYSYANVPRQFLANISLFFFGALYCHAVLYRLRPSASASPFFYLWLSLGGAIGTLLMAMVAPVVFIDFFEFLIGAALFAAVAIAFFPAMKFIRDQFRVNVLTIQFVLILGVFAAITLYEFSKEEDGMFVSRNFYGHVEVVEVGSMRYLYHGTTLHGSQNNEDRYFDKPTTYYVETSGVGRAIIRARSTADGDPIRVGVIGLGSGTLAAYCERGDKFVFYELDPRIGKIANEYFSYVSQCTFADIRYGDGRLTLQNELEEGKVGKYDVLAVDAFSDDTVPVHLLTKEALELYVQHLKGPDSILAIHTSNRFLELAPIVFRGATELGLSAMMIEDDAEDSVDGSLSQWVLVAQDAAALQVPIFSSAMTEPYGASPLWTDDYANVAATVTMPPLEFWSSE